MKTYFRLTFIVSASSVLVAGSSARAQSFPPQLTALIAQYKGLVSDVAALKSQNAALQNQVNSLQAQLTSAHDVLALEPFVRVNLAADTSGVNGPHITFTGANIHVLSGSGATDDHGTRWGLGNLIIGYDEVPPSMGPGNPQDGLFINFGPGSRGGSHNLVIGSGHRFTQAAFGGIVAGELNLIGNEGASVTGGLFNNATGRYASITGGTQNTADYDNTSVTGGQFNLATGALGQWCASVTGGYHNTANAQWASVSGGELNTASGAAANVVGGVYNIAGGRDTVVLGGQNVTDTNPRSIAPQPPFP